MGAIESARVCGAEAGQIWGSNPRAWAHPRSDPELARRFGEAWRAQGLGTLVLHAPYMVNIASPNLDFRRRSVRLAQATVELAEEIDADGVVVHAGAGGVATPREVALVAAAASLLAVLDLADRTTVFVELTAGGSGSVASTFPEARALVDATGGHERLGLCADTCHLFAAGYRLDTAKGARACFDEVRKLGMAKRLRLVHANDSKYPWGQHRDSHSHIGQGYIGERGFRAVLAHPLVRRCTVLCETPGQLEDHARNIATLRRLAAEGIRP
jgi:deoxyribonuclease-4